jgi:hypothetical protein
VLVLSGIGAVMLAAACGGDDPAVTAFTVWAFEDRTAIDGTDTPLAGAEVAFDPPGGGPRVIATTAADGHVTFEGDFTRGGASVTVYEVEHVLVSALEASPDSARARANTLGKPGSDLVLFAPRLDDALRRGTVELRGALLSKRDAASAVDLATSGIPRLGIAAVTPTGYVLRAPSGRPFFLIGHETKSLVNAAGTVENEHIASFRVDVPATSVDTSLDVDIARVTQLPTTTVHLRTELPLAPNSPFGPGSRSSATVVSADSALLVGPIRNVHATADGRAFDLEMTVAQTDIAPERTITRASLLAPDGSQSIRVEQGVVADLTTWKDFPLPPFVAEASRSLADPLPLDDVPAGADLLVEIYAGDQLAWIISGPPGGLREKVVTLPPPLEIRLPALVAASLIAQMDHVTRSPRGEIYRRVAVSRDVVMRR